MSEYIEETLTFKPRGQPQQQQHRPVGLVEEHEALSKEQDRINAHIKVHPVGERGQAMLSGELDYDPNPQGRKNYGPPKQESWVDLHREYADILDTNELQTYKRHFRALGEKDGFLDADSLHETMESFFGQDLERKQITETIAEVDYDNDSKISYREFLEVMCAIKSGDRNRRSKFMNFYKVLVLKNPPFWAQRVGRANSAV